MENNWELVNPLIGFSKEQKDILKSHIKSLNDMELELLDLDESFSITKNLEEEVPKALELKLQATLKLVSDFYRLGWKVKFNKKGLLILKDPIGDDVSRKKDIFRRHYSFQRFNQLNSKSIREFVVKMERMRNFKEGRISILSLMRDGSELSEGLHEILLSDKKSIYPNLIKPYIESVGDGVDSKTCKHTGLKLTEIYRYFRYTWITPAHSVPGRSMKFLVRDSAAENHPVIGIFALSSAAPQLSKRDDSIGWSNEEFLKRIKSKNSTPTVDLILKQINGLIESIRVDDFYLERIISSQDLRVKNEETLRKLDAKAREWKELWEESPENKKMFNDPVRASETYLYKFKRATELSFLLRGKFALEKAKGSKTRIKEFMDAKENLTLLNGVIKRIRSKKLGINIADLTVCGAVPPYNKIIGGKLVSSLAVSPETINLYKKKYQNSVSVIASNMAGRPVTKDADLVYISTTSLFGVRPCQYDNIAIPLKPNSKNSKKSLKYNYLGRLAGGGSMHFSKETTEVLARYMRSESEAKVNYIFGEGASPKLRAIRQGLKKLGFVGEDLIYHGMAKTLYQIKLIDNLPDYLMGFDKKPNYLFSLSASKLTTNKISEWWSTRWATKRILRDKDKLLDEIAKDNFLHPVSHGAKLIMPENQDKQIAFNLEDSVN